jgi:hypothetical protein
MRFFLPRVDSAVHTTPTAIGQQAQAKLRAEAADSGDIVFIDWPSSGSGGGGGLLATAAMHWAVTQPSLAFAFFGWVGVSLLRLDLVDFFPSLRLVDLGQRCQLG